MSAPAAKQGAEEEAERLLAAAKLNPNDGGPFGSLGHHYARAGDGQRAARCYQRAVALDPDDAEAGVSVNDCACTCACLCTEGVCWLVCLLVVVVLC
jgi:superkiller protein 3